MTSVWNTAQSTLEADGRSTIHRVPRLEDALPQQLGLKIEAAKSMIEVMVIDHVDPTPTSTTPEPESLGLVCGGIGAMFFLHRRWCRKASAQSQEIFNAMLRELLIERYEQAFHY